MSYCVEIDNICVDLKFQTENDRALKRVQSDVGNE